jgi:hypothetical protein
MSTVVLQLVGGDEKWTQCLGVQPGQPVPGGYKYWEVVLQVGEVSNLRQENCHESCETRTWEWLRWRRPAAIVNDRPILSLERMLHKDYNRKCLVGK